MKARHPLIGCECNVCKISFQNLDKAYYLEYRNELKLTKNCELIIEGNFLATFCYVGHRRVYFDLMEPQKEREVGVTVFVREFGEEAFISMDKIIRVCAPDSLHNSTYGYELKYNPYCVNNYLSNRRTSCPPTLPSCNYGNNGRASSPSYPAFSFDFVDQCNSRPLMSNCRCHRSISPCYEVPHYIEQVPIYDPRFSFHQYHEIKRSPSPCCIDHRHSPRSCVGHFGDSTDSAISSASSGNFCTRKCLTPTFDQLGNGYRSAANNRRCSYPYM